MNVSGVRSWLGHQREAVSYGAILGTRGNPLRMAAIVSADHGFLEGFDYA